jgi:hypothetical protein
MKSLSTTPLDAIVENPDKCGLPAGLRGLVYEVLVCAREYPLKNLRLSCEYHEDEEFYLLAFAWEDARGSTREIRRIGFVPANRLLFDYASAESGTLKEYHSREILEMMRKRFAETQGRDVG